MAKPAYTMYMTISTKRIYDDVQENDGLRVLVDRLWPRGVSKEKAHIDLWAKNITPSNSLREWFHHDIAGRFDEFSKRYTDELTKTNALTDFKETIAHEKKVSLVSAVKDLEHSHVAVLVKELQKK